MNASLHDGEAIPRAQFTPAFAEEVAHQPEMIREMLVRVQFGKVPAWDIGVQAIHERGVIAHLRR